MHVVTEVITKGCRPRAVDPYEEPWTFPGPTGGIHSARWSDPDELALAEQDTWEDGRHTLGGYSHAQG